jgi:Mg/Co/Ni transporter MgtE
MAGDAVQSGAMGITVKYDRKNPLDELRRVSGADKRPPAVLVTFDFDTIDNKDSPYRNDLVSYLEGTLGGVMVTQSSYAIPYNNAVIDIIARIRQITRDSITAYAFPVQNWYGHGNTIANEWFQKHELPSLP